MKYQILILLSMLILFSCKDEKADSLNPSSKKNVESVEKKPSPNSKPEKKTPVPKPSMDIFAAIDAESAVEIKKNIEFDKTCLEKKDPEKKFHFPLHCLIRFIHHLNQEPYSLPISID